MGGPKPTLGYASRTDAVLALRAKGLSNVLIAERIGISPSTVGALICSHERYRQPRPAEANGRTVVVPVDVLDALMVHAARRGISVNELVRRIVETAADDDLVDAILDDGRDG